MSHYTQGALSSKDGTNICFRTAGSGPALILLHGGMSNSAFHRELALDLAAGFTVVVPDRRDRSGTAPCADYSIDRDVEDVAALAGHFGAQRLWGLSAGAVIALEAARRLPAIVRLAVYEPPIFSDIVELERAGARLNAELDSGNQPAAMVTAMLAAQMGPSFLRLLPRKWLERMSEGLLRDPGTGPDGYPPTGTLIPPLRHDLALAAHVTRNVGSFADISAEVLLMGGARSPLYLRQALDRLATILPRAQRIELPGLGHDASWNTDRGGKPHAVAEAMRPFFLAPL